MSLKADTFERAAKQIAELVGGDVGRCFETVCKQNLVLLAEVEELRERVDSLHRATDSFLEALGEIVKKAL